MTNTDQEFKWLDNIRTSIHALTISGGIFEFYNDRNMSMPIFGFDEPRKHNAFYKFSPRGIEALKPFVPYVLHPVWESDFNDKGEPLGEPFIKSYIWLNRFYKPLGCPNAKFYDYKVYKDFQIDSESKELEQISKILDIYEGHGQGQVYVCYRKLETQKQVRELIEKLLKVTSVFPKPLENF